MDIDISVLMCVFNEKKSDLKKAIESILRQSCHDFEFIIIMDNPNNYELINYLYEYAKSDDRINLIIHNSKIGFPQSLNEGIYLAKGKYIARMDADDISSPNRLQYEKKILDDNPEISVVSGNIVFIDEQDDLIRHNISYFNCNEIIPELMKYSNVVMHPCVMFRKFDVERMGGYRELEAAEDYDLWLRMLDDGYKFFIINKILLKYRLRNTSQSYRNAMMLRLTTKYLRMNYKSGIIPSVSEVNTYVHDSINKVSEDKYIEACKRYYKSWDYLHSGRIILFIFLLFSSFCYSKEMFFVFFESLCFNAKVNCVK